MAEPGGKFVMKILTLALRMPVGIAVRKAVAKTWSAARPDVHKREAKEAGVHWSDALLWSALSAAGIAAVQLITRSSAEEAFRIITGNEPPPAPPTKAQKKATKQEAKEEKKAAKAAAKAAA